MSKNVLKYEDTKLIKSKKKKGKGFGVLLVCLFILGGVIYLSGVLGNAISVGSFSFMFNNNNIKVKEHSYYAVVMGEYDSEKDAQKVASGVSVMGAGGYVWSNNQKYYVIGNVYKLKTDAENVLKNMSATNYSCFVKEIKYKKIDYSAENLTKEQRGVINNCIEKINEIFERCYNYAIRFDKGEVVSTVVSSELNTLKGELLILASKLDAINSVSPNTKTVILKNSIVNINNEIENTILKVIDGTSVNKDLKYLTTSIAVIKYNFYNEVNNV